MFTKQPPWTEHVNNILEMAEAGLRDPSLFLRKLNQLSHRARNGWSFNRDGIDVMAQDWDNLIILDACRFDLFDEHCDIEGDLTRVESRGSSTFDFMLGNFGGRSHMDTVYVTANPRFYRARDQMNSEFYRVVNVWNGRGWDADAGTVRPETVTENAARISDEYPHKRLVVHYIQPHYPFLDSDLEIDRGHLEGQKKYNIWMQLRLGLADASPEEVYDAYATNFRRALPSVEGLVEQLDGKTVVTSDHGNLFNERVSPLPVREWGHPRNMYVDGLIEVPWLDVGTNGERRTIHAEEAATAASSVADEKVEERLANLGYIE